MKRILQISLVIVLCSFSANKYDYVNINNTLAPEEEELLLDFEEFAEDSYGHIGVKDLFFKPYKLALQGYFKMLAAGELQNPEYLTVVDMTKSANVERMYIIDTESWQVVHKSLVSHGMNTGEEFAQHFSNTESSHQSSLGFYKTAEVYNGKHEKSLKLDGLELFNSNARDRGVVVHAADYVSHDYVKSNGRLGRSYGCPALPFDQYDKVIDMIKDGSCFFIYYPEKDYLKKSKYINAKINAKLTCEGQLAELK